MKTSKPISTISYNTEEFLRGKIWEWKNKGLISYGMWIRHEPDVDGDKPHFHVFMQPSRQIQTDDLIFQSIEIDKSWQPLESYQDEKEKERHERKQYLKMTVFKSSEPSNWILYGLHDERYLLEKGLSRNVHYEPSDIESTCDDTFMDMLSCAYDFRNNKLEFRIIDLIMQGQTWYQIVRSGMIPLKQMNSALTLYKALTMQEKVDRHLTESEQLG